MKTTTDTDTDCNPSYTTAGVMWQVLDLYLDAAEDQPLLDIALLLGETYRGEIALLVYEIALTEDRAAELLAGISQ